MSISLKDVKFLNKSFIGIIRDVDINLQIRGAKFFRQAVITRRFPRRWRRQAAGSQSTREAFQVLGLNTSGTWAVSLDQMTKKLTAAARGVTGERKRRWQKVVVAADDEPLSESYFTGSHDYAEGAGYRFAYARDQECNWYLCVPIFERSKIFLIVILFFFLSFSNALGIKY